MTAIAGMAVAFKLAATEQFHALQRQTVANARGSPPGWRSAGCASAWGDRLAPAAGGL